MRREGGVVGREGEVGSEGEVGREEVGREEVVREEVGREGSLGRPCELLSPPTAGNNLKYVTLSSHVSQQLTWSSAFIHRQALLTGGKLSTLSRYVAKFPTSGTITSATWNCM